MFKKVTFGLILIGILSWTEAGATVNTIQTVSSSVNLNFGTGGVKQQIQMFLVNSDDPAGFHLTFTFSNKGKFISGPREITMTSIVLNKVGGTIGAGLNDPVDYALAV